MTRKRLGLCQVLLYRRDQGVKVFGDREKSVLRELRELTLLIDHLLQVRLATVELVVDPCERIVDDLERIGRSHSLSLNRREDLVKGHHDLVGNFRRWLLAGLGGPFAQNLHGDARDPSGLGKLQWLA